MEEIYGGSYLIECTDKGKTVKGFLHHIQTKEEKSKTDNKEKTDELEEPPA